MITSAGRHTQPKPRADAYEIDVRLQCLGFDLEANAVSRVWGRSVPGRLRVGDTLVAVDGCTLFPVEHVGRHDSFAAAIARAHRPLRLRLER